MPNREIQAAKRRQALGITAFLLLLAGSVSGLYHFARADAVSYHRGEKAYSRGDYAAALPHFARARSLGMDTLGLRWHYASALIETGNHAEALPLLQSILADNPRDSAALAAAVGAAQSAGSPAIGIALYHSLGPREKLSPTDLARLGDLYQQDGQIDEAIACFDALLALYPASPELHTLLGQLHLRAGHRDEAQIAFLTALGLDPHRRAARLAIARLHAWEGRFDDSATAYRAYLGDH